jgi:phosphoglycolate phosphatase-like HAD superfamily hydrolase
LPVGAHLKVLVFDIDGVLLDVRPSFYEIVRQVSGATLEDIRRFKDNGGFNDDWELARAAAAWVQAGRPDVFGRVASWQDVMVLCGGDPGDLSLACSALYRDGYWKRELPLVESTLLRELSARWRVVACTGRDRWELARAEELLHFQFHDATTREIVKKPHADALLRLIPDGAARVLMFGDSHDDRRTVENAREMSSIPIEYEHVTRSPESLLRALLERQDG